MRQVPEASELTPIYVKVIVIAQKETPMTTPGIGHNSNALGQGWRRFAWKKARKDLVAARVPLEIVRIRVRRAQKLGLTYPQYASVLLGSGRDIVGFLFTVNGLQLRLLRRLEAPDHVAAKLQYEPQSPRIVLSPSEEAPETFRVELADTLAARIDAAAPAPAPATSWGAARRAVQNALAETQMPADGVVMIGAGDEDALWADAAFLAKFIPSSEYFTHPS